MPSSDNLEITQILEELSGDGSDSAIQRLLPLVYAELRSLSQAFLGEERVDHTLEATALVHEAYVRLAGSSTQQWASREHFFRVAAKTMRRILINHARRRNAQRRGSGRPTVALQETMLLATSNDVDLESLDDAMTRLAGIDRVKAQVVELRFFAGCTIEETAAVIRISPASVERHWSFARAWLQSELLE